jgi:hypothetical protein
VTAGVSLPIHSLRHHPRRRMIQYSAAPVIDVIGHGVLDARFPGMTTE